MLPGGVGAAELRWYWSFEQRSQKYATGYEESAEKEGDLEDEEEVGVIFGA